MSLIQAFRGLRPAAGQAGAIAAPPYDVLSSDEARQRAAGKPWSFLHISKAEIDLPREVDPHAPAVYAKAAENMRRMLEGGVTVRDAEDAVSSAVAVLLSISCITLIATTGMVGRSAAVMMAVSSSLFMQIYPCVRWGACS